jgi:hypothetical protein
MPDENADVRIIGMTMRCVMLLRAFLMRVLFACIVTAVAGCASLPPATPDDPEVASPGHEHRPEPARPEEPVEVLSERTPVPDSPPMLADDVFGANAAIVLSDRSTAYQGVATELAGLLNRPLIYNLADRNQTPEAAFAGIAESRAEVVIAIGLAAAQAATALSTVPVVYCQVFNFDSQREASVPVKGVAAIPPLSIQVEAWKGFDPALRSIGAILGEGHDALIAEATSATLANGLEFHYRIANSDRETLYLFKRMAPDVDGFWLFPDNRVLSVPVLRQLVEIAARHGVRIAVFNEALLELGVSLSTAAVEADIAETVLSVARQMASGADDSVPDLTPLRDLKLRGSSSSHDRSDAVAAGEGASGGAPRGRL